MKTPAVVFSLLLALLAGCDSREALVERCVAAYIKEGRSESSGRVYCMTAAYGPERR
jgi:hypothetical protein